MQVTHDFDQTAALPVGYGVRVLFLSAQTDGPLQARIAGLGGAVEVETEIYAALAAVIDDPMGYGLFVMDCDGLGGGEAGAARGGDAGGGEFPRAADPDLAANMRRRSFRNSEKRQFGCVHPCRRSACGSGSNMRCAIG